MALSFHHGTRVFESAENPVLVRIAQTAVIGLIGTAPDADPLKFPLNKPVQILKPTDAADLGDAGTLKDNIDSVFDQIVTPIVVVRVEEGANTQATWANLIGDFSAYTGVHAFLRAQSDGLYKPKILLASGWTTSAPADGIASVNVTVAGSGYTQATVSVTIAGDGTGAEAKAVVASDGTIASILITKPGYGYSNATATVADTGSGVNATATANIGAVMNPVVAELAGVADKLWAMTFVDGTDSTDQAAVQYRQLINSQRIAVCDPKVLKFDTATQLNIPKPTSAIFAGLQAKRDNEQGFWWAGSNVPIAGIVGVNRPVIYGEQSDYLNENRINTIVNIKTSNGSAGYRAWGVWTCAQELLWQFISVRRTADVINEALEEAYLEFVAKPFSKANLKFLVESGAAFLRTLELEGAILPGSKVWLLDTNTDSEMAQGKVKLGVMFEPPAPMVDIQLTAHRNIAAYTLLLKEVVEEIGSGSLAAAA